MPQMSPMWWIILNQMFIFLFLMMITMLYFNLNYLTLMLNNKYNKKYFNWTWKW